MLALLLVLVVAPPAPLVAALLLAPPLPLVAPPLPLVAALLPAPTPVLDAALVALLLLVAGALAHAPSAPSTATDSRGRAEAASRDRDERILDASHDPGARSKAPREGDRRGREAGASVAGR